MSFFFDVYGSFGIKRENGAINRSQLELWKEVEDADKGLSTAIGCYMFCLANGESITPWYIGQTKAERGFHAETFTDHKLSVYNSCLDEMRGRPRLFLMPMMTGDAAYEGRFSKNRSAGGKVIDWLEKTLMGMALQRNTELWNIRDLSLPRSVTVRGIIGAATKGRPYIQVQEARRALFG